MSPAGEFSITLDAPDEASWASAPAHQDQHGTSNRMASRCWRLICFFWKWLIGALNCLSLLGSVLVIGWTYRAAQRAVLKNWWRRSDRSARETFESFVAQDERLQQHRHWPNWIVQQNFWTRLRQGAAEGAGLFGRLGWFFKLLGYSLWLNLKIGAQGLFNTWVLTLPGCALWLFAWYDGWNNSFNKGYEQAPVGPLTGLLGVALFIAAMLYVPMAQVRQAATGDWRTFYQFRFVWQLISRRWLGCLGLAALYTLLALPFTLMLRALPTFFDQMLPQSHSWTDQQVLAFLRQYFFWCSVGLLPAFLLLRLAAARVYAGALLAAVETRRAQSHLTEQERLDLRDLGLLRERAAPPRHVLVRTISWGSVFSMRSAAFLGMLLLWFAFVAQIFVSEFVNYHPGIGWLNQPLVQLPYYNYVPGHLLD